MYVGGDHQPCWILLGGRRDKQHAPVLTTDVVDILVPVHHSRRGI